MNYLVNVMGSH